MRLAPILLLIPVLHASVAHAEPEVHRLTWSLRVEGAEVGKRTAVYTVEREGDDVRRSIEAHTKLTAKVGSLSWSWEQKLTAHGAVGPDAFRSVILEDGAPREVQGRWSPTAWTLAQGDARSVRTYEAAPYRIDLSTADLIDPYASRTLGRFATIKVLSAETGEVIEGTVEPLGPTTVRVGATDVNVQGWAWNASIGRSQFWYDEDGWLVKYETTILGRKVEGVLLQPPPSSPDAFVAPPMSQGVQSEDL